MSGLNEPDWEAAWGEYMMEYGLQSITLHYENGDEQTITLNERGLAEVVY